MLLIALLDQHAPISDCVALKLPHRGTMSVGRHGIALPAGTRNLGGVINSTDMASRSDAGFAPYAGLSTRH